MRAMRSGVSIGSTTRQIAVGPWRSMSRSIASKVRRCYRRAVIEGGPGRFVGDRYHLVRELGRGGMGVVFLGRDLRREMDVAIKFRGVTHHDATLWLKREFRAVASLRHPNLVELYELVAHDGSCYFTMEYLPG